MSTYGNLLAMAFGNLRISSLNESQYDEAHAKALRAERRAAVFELTPILMITNVVIAVLCGSIFVGHAIFPFVVAWVAIVCALASYGLMKVLSRNRSRARSGSSRARRVLTMHAAVLACVWAFPPLVLIPASVGYEGYILTGVMAGIMAGGPFALAPIPRAALTWLGICTLANVVAFASVGDPLMLSLAGATVVWAVLIAYNVLRLAIAETERFSEVYSASQQSDALAEQRDVIELLLREYETDGGDWRWRTDNYGTLLRAPDELLRILGLTEADLAGIDCFNLVMDKALPEAAENVKQLKGATARRDRFTDILIAVDDRRPGKESRCWISLSGKPQWDADGEFDGYRGSAADVTATHEAERRIHFLATRDALTGLWNRTSLNENVQALILANRTFVYGQVDLDRFKSCNDRLGHNAGDELLQRVARILSTHARASLGDEAMVSRVGGDEFAFIVPGRTEDVCRRRAEQFADRVIRDVAQTHQLQAGAANIGASIGFAVYPRDAATELELSKRSDLALYRAKNDGRGCWRMYDQDRDARQRERGTLQTDLRLALARGEISVAYQPIISVASDQTSAMEALMRWEHPVQGNIPPSVFLPIAEETGLIQALGAWVLREACREAATWSDEQTVTVNVSASQLLAPDFVSNVRIALRSARLEPTRLEIEITEGGLLDDLEHALGALTELRRIGVSIALDDFGRSYSSLSYLREFKFDRIKIDRTFVSALLAEENGAGAIVRSIVELAGTLGISTTASGVERDEQIEILRNLGCSEMQGFLLGQPAEAGVSVRTRGSVEVPRARDIRVSSKRIRKVA